MSSPQRMARWSVATVIWLCGLLWICEFVQINGQAVYYVATNGSDSNSGSLDSPFATLQQAVSSIGQASGGTVIIMPGIYTCGTGNANITLGTVDINITSEAGPTQTVFNCNNAAASIFLIYGTEGLISISGLTFVNSTGSFIVMVRDAAANFSDCTFAQSSQNSSVYILDASPTFVNCSFINNTGGMIIPKPLGSGGGAVFLNYTYEGNYSAQFTDCTFSGNHIVGAGSSVLLWANYKTTTQPSLTTLLFHNCTFSNNSAFGTPNFPSFGGAFAVISAYRLVPRAGRSPLSDKLHPPGSRGEPPGVFAASDSSANDGYDIGGQPLEGPFVVIMANCTFVDNTAGNGGAMFIELPGTAVVLNSRFQRNTARGTIEQTGGAAGSGGAINQLIAQQLLVVDSVFTANNATESGGAVLAAWGAVTISYTVFSGNAAGRGGGGCSLGTNTNNVIIENSSFIHNTAAVFGGAIAMSSIYRLNVTATSFLHNSAGPQTTIGSLLIGGGAVALVTSEVSNGPLPVAFFGDCNFEYNQALGPGDGGAMLVRGYTVALTGGNFSANTAMAGGRGGAVFVAGGAGVNAAGLSFWGNRALFGGGAVFLEDQATPSYFADVRFSENEAGTNGGAVMSAATCTFVQCIFEQNNVNPRIAEATNYYYGSVSFSGGALYLVPPSSTTINSTAFIANYIVYAYEYYYQSANFSNGGAIAFDGNGGLPGEPANGLTAAVFNSSFSNNEAINQGGAVYANGPCSVNFTTCVFENNSVSSVNGWAGGAFSIVNVTSLIIRDALFYNNTAPLPVGSGLLAFAETGGGAVHLEDTPVGTVAIYDSALCGNTRLQITCHDSGKPNANTTSRFVTNLLVTDRSGGSNTSTIPSPCGEISPVVLTPLPSNSTTAALLAGSRPGVVCGADVALYRIAAGDAINLSITVSSVNNPLFFPPPNHKSATTAPVANGNGTTSALRYPPVLFWVAPKRSVYANMSTVPADAMVLSTTPLLPNATMTLSYNNATGFMLTNEAVYDIGVMVAPNANLSKAAYRVRVTSTSPTAVIAWSSVSLTGASHSWVLSGESRTLHVTLRDQWRNAIIQRSLVDNVYLLVLGANPGNTSVSTLRVEEGRYFVYDYYAANTGDDTFYLWDGTSKPKKMLGVHVYWMWWAVIGCVVAVVVLAAVFGAVAVLCRRYRRGSGGLRTQLRMPTEDTAPLLAPTNEIEYSDLEIIHPPIGQGAYGVVSKAHYNGTIVAVKMFSLVTINDEDPFRSLIREVELMHRLRHPNIVLFMGICRDPPCIITEYVSRGSLFDVILHSPMDLTWKRIARIALETCRGMLYLHSQRPPVLHRDLKSPNVLISADWHAKLCDFGISRVLSDMSDRQISNSGEPSAGPNPARLSAGPPLTVGVGTARWRAPEVLKSAKYGRASDVYSWAMVMFEAIAKQLPFAEERFESVVEEEVAAGRRPVIPEDCPVQFAELITECWSHDPALRPDFKTILERLEVMTEGLFTRG